jgi:hypothetical protein
MSHMKLICTTARFVSHHGFLSFQVRRALVIMHQRDEVEYKRERHVIVRKA